LQAEDGIRDRNVTGVQTCALPISTGSEDPPAGQPPLDTCPEAGALGLRKGVHRRGGQFGRSIGQDGVDETVRLPHALVLARVLKIGRASSRARGYMSDV